MSKRRKDKPLPGNTNVLYQYKMPKNVPRKEFLATVAYIQQMK